MKFSFNKKKLLYGSAGTVFVALFIAVAVVVNIFAEFLTDRFSLKLDMTDSGKFSLSDTSRDMLRDLDCDINIYILSSRPDMEKNESAKLTLETIQRYNSESGGKVKYEFIDPNKNPQFFSKYPNAKNAKLRDLIIEGPNRYVLLQNAEFSYQFSGKQNMTFSQHEEMISCAILHVSSNEIAEAGFVSGHGEIAPDALVSYFDGNYFRFSDVDLLSKIPEGIENLVISAPSADFTEEEIAELDKYLSVGNRNLYVFWSMETPSLPTLERYLSEWGFSFPSYVICDEENSYMSPAVVVTKLLDTEIMKNTGDDMSFILAPEARPIEILPTGNGPMRVTALVKTGDTAFSKLLSGDNTISEYTRSKDDVDGPFVTVAISEKALTNSKDGVSRVVAFGSAAIAFEEICSVARASNTDFIASIVDYANPNTKTMKISPKVASSHDLNITEGEASLIRILLIGIIPSLIILAGIIVFIKRKNR